MYSNDVTILLFTETQMSAGKTDKAFWHNFDVLNLKMLVTQLNFEY